MLTRTPSSNSRACSTSGGGSWPGWKIETAPGHSVGGTLPARLAETTPGSPTKRAERIISALLADAQLFDNGGIVQSALLQILDPTAPTAWDYSALCR